MKSLRKRTIWIFLTLFLLPILTFGFWYGRQVRLDYALIEAVASSNQAQIASLLDKGANPNADQKSSFDATGFLFLVKNMIRQLQHHSTDTGEPALILAAQNADCSSMILLLNRGANINARDDGGVTALEYAVTSSKPSKGYAIKLLLDRHAEVNTLDNCQMTPLSYAQARKNVTIPPDADATEIVGSLKQAGAKE